MMESKCALQVNTRHIWKISTTIVCRYFLEISLEGLKKISEQQQ